MKSPTVSRKSDKFFALDSKSQFCVQSQCAKKRKGFFHQKPTTSNSEEVQRESAPTGGSPLTSPQHKVGVVITSSRQAHRRFAIFIFLALFF